MFTNLLRAFSDGSNIDDDLGLSEDSEEDEVRAHVAEV